MYRMCLPHTFELPRIANCRRAHRVAASHAAYRTLLSITPEHEDTTIVEKVGYDDGQRN
jgi:hypothetical protein